MEECATQCPLPFVGMKILQEEARKAKPTALNRDDESSNSGYTGNSPALGIARELPQSRDKGFKMALRTKGSLVRV